MHEPTEPLLPMNRSKDKASQLAEELRQDLIQKEREKELKRRQLEERAREIEIQDEERNGENEPLQPKRVEI